jgi:GT2 family glycosyltransferase
MAIEDSSKENIQMIETTLTIIIVNWNNKKILQDCLESIYNTQVSYSYKIIVVDNNSEDGSVELIKNKFVDVILIENNNNFGFAKANNQAIKIAKTDHILLLNNDTIITQNDCFSNMVRFMQENPIVGVLGCKLLFPNGTLQSLGEKYTSVWEIFKKQILFCKTWERFRKNKEKGNIFKKVDWVSGACLLTRKEVFEKVGMLKENYFMCGEDVEFCYRVNKAGWKIGVLTGESIIHLLGKSTEKNLTETFYHSIDNNLKNIEIIHNDNWKVLSAKVFYLIGILMRAVLAIFRKDKKVVDYLKIFKKILTNGE